MEGQPPVFLPASQDMELDFPPIILDQEVSAYSLQAGSGSREVGGQDSSSLSLDFPDLVVRQKSLRYHAAPPTWDELVKLYCDGIPRIEHQPPFFSRREDFPRRPSRPGLHLGKCRFTTAPEVELQDLPELRLVPKRPPVRRTEKALHCLQPLRDPPDLAEVLASMPRKERLGLRLQALSQLEVGSY